MTKRKKDIKTYAFRSSYRIPAGTDPNLVAAALAELPELTPPAVVEAARDETSPLHSCFTWDDGEAAEAYRRMEARVLIRAVKVVMPDGERRSVYVSVREGDDGQYRPLDMVVQQQDWFVAALTQARGKLHSAQAAVDELETAARMRGEQPDRLARLSLAIEAMKTAAAALQ